MDTKDPLIINRREDFPIFQNHPEWVYLDTAATTQKPKVVLETEKNFYENSYANVHRSFYDIGMAATEAFEGVRVLVKEFINAGSATEIIFTANATAAINLAAEFETDRIQPGDEILVSSAGHHSNILPWRRLAQRKGAYIRWIEIGEDGRLDMADFYKKLSNCTRIVAVSQVSNVLGYVLPLPEIIKAAHRVGARVLVDGAQSVARLPINVQDLDIDYLAVSGHKLYGPTGTGWLYAKRELLESMTPPISGGGTILQVTRDKVEWNEIPLRFEAGTPHIAGVVGLGAALKYLNAIGMEEVWEHDQAITRYALEKLAKVPGLKMYGPLNAEERAGVYSFTLEGKEGLIHSHDLTTIANESQVAIRGGRHCAHPLLNALGAVEITRASTGVYTTTGDIDRLIEVLEKAPEIL